jgi:hypothetical protein
MPAVSFGVTEDWGEERTAGYCQEISRDISAEIVTIRGSNGRVVVATNKPRTVTTITAKMKGASQLLSLVMGTKNSGVAFLTSSKISETNDDFATSETTVTIYE